MSKIDFIDLFDDEEEAGDVNNASYSYQEHSPDVTAQAAPVGQRMKINDYKHSSQTLQRTHTAPQAQAAAPAPSASPVKSLKLDDEKIVWAGAIFVFFGVFVFLIGYWLGKATLKSVKSSNEQYVASIQDKLEQQQMENSMTMPLNREGKVDSITPTPEMEGQPTIKTPQAVEDIDPIVAPPIKDPDLKKPEAVVAKKTETKPVETVKKTEPKPQISADAKGDYTLQVSAHSDLEKARAIEGQLRNSGMQAYIVESMVNGVRYFRVRVGKFNSKSEAQTALTKVKSLSIGKDAYLIDLK